MKMKKMLFALLTLAMVMPVTNVKADSEAYLVLGKDLNANEKATVLKLLGVENENDYNVSYVTHDEEKKYLSSYISASQIGSRALSSVLLEQMDTNAGITVETKNITYVTEKMYQNALITAGVKDVKLTVAGPFKISGTAALVAATKSYEIMTGKTLNNNAVDTANNELSVTSDVAKETGSKDDAADLVAALKQNVASMGDDYTREKGKEALKEIENKQNIQLNEDTENKILDLMDKIKGINLDEDALKTQAKNIYESIKGYADIINKNKGILTTIASKVKEFLSTIINFFTGK
ncbi:DUF1002 domain-containing protein [Sharpea azabuensis]|uniref:Uncharacterized protein YpuA, DUF1002 family n=1 Tax=Sharpea azabuensis TaxID=322505 RepID=A0A1H6XCQ2_9FIRM|nr:DUF1002 domain-containing protein [Sharpea azabuensis]MDD6513264.1 DUF1002 domain-containing protein [Sharpea azabuensis]SEJ22622.1 Uncharacterized protein YpuA, DUF1002 family [Sharpea azabuensis]SFD41122.1 Uncharacterized protein YpuA, DUF1002 family [Sharpea azabuensis]SFK44281.1 Uncharacterized protein YpuA, DUF1002 family [Sharpea azabuensis]